MPNSHDRHLNHRLDPRDPRDLSDRDGSPENAHVNPPSATLNSHRPTPAERAYQDGYVSGQVAEQRMRRRTQIIRDNENAARGLLIGIGLTSILAVTLGLLFLFNTRRQPEPAVAPGPVVAPASPNATTRQNTNRQTTVIERSQQTVPVPVPVPQQSGSSSQSAPATGSGQSAPGVSNTVVGSPAPQPNTRQPAPQPASNPQNAGQSGSPNSIAPAPAGQTGTQNPNGNNPGVNNQGINNQGINVNPTGTANPGATVTPGNVTGGTNAPANTPANTPANPNGTNLR